MSRTLNEITQDLAKFHGALMANGGEIALAAESLGKTPEEFEKAYDAIAFEDATKLDAYIFRIEESKSKAAAAKAMYDQWKARADEWAALVKAEEKSQEFMKSRLKLNMEVKGETTITTAEGRKISIQNNGGKLPLIIDEEKFNALSKEDLEYLEAEGIVALQPMLSKAELLKVLEAEPTIAERMRPFEFAKLGERGTQIRFK